MLWHKKLGHILQDRMNMLVKDGILPPLKDDLKEYVAYVKVKMVKTKRTSSAQAKTFRK